jgi:hypothetical protein
MHQQINYMHMVNAGRLPARHSAAFDRDFSGAFGVSAVFGGIRFG